MNWNFLFAIMLGLIALAACGIFVMLITLRARQRRNERAVMEEYERPNPVPFVSLGKKDEIADVVYYYKGDL